jgi:hypothetical protein
MQRNIKSIALNANIYLNRIAVLLACVCAVSALLYGIFLLEAVAHAASQTSAQRRVGQISAQLGDIEAHYLSYSQALTKERAIELGFTTPTETSTVFAAATRVLSFRGQ